MILVDTNVLVALADRGDAHHLACSTWLSNVLETLLIPTTVLAEACYLIDRALGARAEAAFLDAIGSGPAFAFHLVDLVDDDLRRMAELVRQYADRRLGGTDASLIALSERLGITTIATLNARDFANVRPRHVRALTLVPS